MLLLLIGILSGMLFRDIILSLVSHLHDLIISVKNDIVGIKDKLLILVHLKDKAVVNTDASKPVV